MLMGHFDLHHIPSSSYSLYMDSLMVTFLNLHSDLLANRNKIFISVLKASVLHLTSQILLPNHIMTHFEQAIINAYQMAFPAATVDGCYFHLQLHDVEENTGIGSCRSLQPIPSGKRASSSG